MKRVAMYLVLFILFGNVSTALGFPAVEVYQKTSEAVVLIVAQMDSKSNMAGAGSLITESGMVITNAHVVVNKKTNRPSKNISVYLKPGRLTGDLKRDLARRYRAKVVAYDTDLDLALLRIEEMKHSPEAIEIANSDEIMIGEEVVAIGHPEQGGLWSLTYGRIGGHIANQSNIKGKDVFQTDASVNRGNSGGPLLDKRGYMVGINTNIARMGAGDLPITGVNFALKSSVVKGWLETKGLQVAYGTRELHDETHAVPVKSEVPETQTEEKREIIETKPLHKKEVEAEAEVKEEKATITEQKPSESEMPKSSDVTKAEEKEDSDLIKEFKEGDKDIFGDVPDGRLLTEKRPYTFDELFDEVEKEMEDLMEEMRWKIRR